MIVSRVTDAQRFAFLGERASRLQATIARLEAEIASGRRLLAPEDDPLGAALAVRLDAELAALRQDGESSRFGIEVLGAQDQTLADAGELLARAEEIAAQQSSGLATPEARAAAREEVHGLLEALTALANGELAGRRLFGGLALDAPAPFAAVPDDLAAYDPATAYGGPSIAFTVGVGGERVRVASDGGAVFGSSLAALARLWTALDPAGDPAAALDAVRAAHADLGAERASVGARQARLTARGSQVNASIAGTEAALSGVRDADVASVIARLSAAQAALEATLALTAQTARPTLASLLAF